jgi:GYF domain 2
MDQWYYAKDGQQVGPVTFEQLREIARNGGITATSQVWNETLKDWTPAAQVTGIFAAAAPSGPPADPSNPYAAPQSDWVTPTASAGDALAEIVPGSDPLDPAGCIKRGFEIAKRNAGTVALAMLVYLGITYGLSIFLELLKIPLIGFSGSSSSHGDFSSSGSGVPGLAIAVIVVIALINQGVAMFLNLGLIRIWLNLVSGKQATVGMIFGEGGKLLTAILASILFFIAVVLGLVLLIVPGIYIALRYGQFMNAIVDKNMGVMDAFSYSSSITTNNPMPLFLFWLLAFLVTIAGFLALCVGVFVAMPIVWLSATVAYRWMQYGHRAAMDHPGTQVPLLANQ